MSEPTHDKTIAALFTQWQGLTKQLAQPGNSLRGEFDRLNAERIDVEDAISRTAPATLDDLARKVMVAGATEDVQSIEPDVLARDAAQLLGLQEGAPEAAGIAALFDEWVRRNNALPRSDAVSEAERQEAIEGIAELEDTILIIPSQSMLDVYRKVIIASDGTPSAGASTKDEWLVVEAHRALGLPLAPIGTSAS